MPAPLPAPPTAAEIEERNQRTALAVPAAHAEWFGEALRAAIPEATLRNYQSAARGMGKHCRGRLPDDDAVLSRIRELDEEGRSVSAMRMAVAAAKFIRKHAGAEPLGDAPTLAVGAIAKARKNAGMDARQAAAIRSAHLPDIEEAAAKRRAVGLGKERPETAVARSTLDRVILRLARIGLMRVSELERLRLADIEPKPEGGATLTFRRSKGGRDGVCVITERMLDAINSIDRTPRQGAPDRREFVIPLSGRSIARRIKRLAKEGGIEGASSHSARVGMARDLVQRGASIVQLQNAGGWKSPEQPGHYARRETAEEGVVAQMFPEG